MQRKNYFGLVVLVAACGESAPSVPDAAPMIDAAPPCQGVGADVVVETDDMANDTTPQATGKTLTAATPIELCGQIEQRNTGDAFSFTLAEPARVRVHVNAPDAAAAEDVFAFISSPESIADDDGRRATSAVKDGRITFVAPNCYGNAPACAMQVLPAGEYHFRISPFSFTQQPPSRTFEYRARITTYDADASCPVPTTVAYTEARDMDPANDQNDVVKTGTEGGMPTDNPNDAPEPSAASLVIVPGEGKRVTGVAGTRTDDTDDLDTYLLVTGPGTTALDVRVGWNGAADDIDVDLYESAPGFDGFVGRGWGRANPEYTTMAVKPNMQHVLVVLRYGEAAALPYDITLCGTAEP